MQDSTPIPHSDFQCRNNYEDKYVKDNRDSIKQKLLDYNPTAVKRIMIDKEGKGKRPLGISTVEDRLIQQLNYFQT